jgi:ubiquinone/menaquinone biosynthesis C-methylase UbiE
MVDPSLLRASFNDAAREYDAIRPGYPDALIQDVIDLSVIPAGGSILEVGCGTGQATLPFARRGYTMHCLDIGAEMLALAAEKLRDYPSVRFEQAAFEDWSPPPAGFDLLISATAFHWVPKEVRYARAADALKENGALAVFSNEHPRSGSGFFEESQAVYRQIDYPWNAPGQSRPDRGFTQAVLKATAAEMDATGLFAPVIVRTYPWQQAYSTKDYLRLLNTYSDHRMLSENQRKELFTGLADLIDLRYGGQVVKDYLGVLYLARRGSAAQKEST